MAVLPGETCKYELNRLVYTAEVGNQLGAGLAMRWVFGGGSDREVCLGPGAGTRAQGSYMTTRLATSRQ